MKDPTIGIRDWIIIHIAYRDIFNAPVGLEDLQDWIGQKKENQLKIELNLLVESGVLETDGLTHYCLAGRASVFRYRLVRKRLSQKSLTLHTPILWWLSLFPFVRFIGISGSIAANNATVEKVGYRKNKVDLDIFIITAPHSLWLVCFIERFISNLLTPLLKSRYTLCFNYSMDGSFLEIHNKGLYTATELFNLKPIYNSNQAYQKLLKSNEWVQLFYPNLKCDFLDTRINLKTILSSILSMLIAPLNMFAYLGFHFSRVLKHQNIKLFSEVSVEFNPQRYHNLKRWSPPNGGYEVIIMKQFEERLIGQFSELRGSELFRFLFPNQKIDDQISDKEFILTKEAFAKYSFPKSV